MNTTALLKKELLDENKDKENPVLLFLLLYVCGLMILAIMLIFTTALCKVTLTSMNNYLSHGDYILLNKLDKSYECGEVVVFYSQARKSDLVKRVVAVGGETIMFDYEGDIVYLYKEKNGEFKKVNENFLPEPMLKDDFVSVANGGSVQFGAPFKINRGEIYVLGDNRNVSIDSRAFGAVKCSSVVGVMYAKVDKGSFAEWLLKKLYQT